MSSVPSACGTWTELSADQTPFVRDDQCMVYDPVRDRLLIFGGTTGDPGPIYTNEVWALSLGATPTLTQVTTSGTPPDGRSDASMIYDLVRDRLVVFGGIGNGAFNDAWALSLSGTPTWTEIVPAAAPPTERAFHTAIYDATRDRMIVYGGYDYGGGTGDLGDVWSLNFSGTPTWTLMSPGGTTPPPRSIHSAVYDGPRDRMVVFGGYDGGSTPSELNDTWALALAGAGTWSPITPSGGPPAIRFGHVAIADGPRNRMLVFGGFVNADPFEYGDVWSLSFTNPIRWTQLSPTGPTPIPAPYFASVYDPVRQRMLALSADEFWALGNLAGTPAWSMLTPPGQVPRRRGGATAIYDAPRQRIVMFGGAILPENIWAHDLWAYSLTGGGWNRIVPTGGQPTPRGDATAIADLANNRMILFGGIDDNGYRNDTWQLSLSGSPAWTPLTPSGTPPSEREGHTAIFDAPRNRMVIYGGYTWGSIANSDVWALSLAGGTSWSPLSPSGFPAPARAYHAAIFDAPRNRMVTFGGGGDDSVRALALAGSPAWSTVSVTGTPAPSENGQPIAFDAARDRMLLMGNFNQTFELRLSGTPAWGSVATTAYPPIGRMFPGSVFDAGNDRWVILCGVPGTYLNDVQALSFPPAFPLTTQPSPSAGGAVEVDPAADCQPSGSVVTLTALPAANYVFTGWSGDASGTTNPLTVTMNAAKNITANFDNFTLTIAVSPGAGGTVTRNPALTYYPPNSSVTLTANPATGYGFANWSGDASGSTNPLSVTMNSSKNITATFVGYPVTVTIAPTGAGTVSKSPNQATYAPGTQVTLTASSSYPFGGWSGDASGSTNPLVVTVDGPKNITASFQAYTLTTNVAPTGGGTVAKSPNQTLYGGGTEVTLTAAPASGYQFMSWSGDVTGSQNPATLIMDANKTATATFTLTPPTCGGWSTVPTATKPSARKSPTAIWDPIRHRMVVFGGFGFNGPSADTWALSMGATPSWSMVAPPGGPGGRWEAASFFDVARDRLVVFGGYNSGIWYLNDVWALPLNGSPTWSQISPAGTPPAGRKGPYVIYDPLRDRMLLFGGLGWCGAGCSVGYNDVWQLTLAGTPTWTQLSPLGTPPPFLFSGGAIYDPVRDRMVILGGYGTTNTAWALSLSGTPTWSNLNPWGAPQVASDFQAVYDSVRDRAVLVKLDGSGKVSTLDFKIQPNQPLWTKEDAPGGGVRDLAAASYDPDDDLVLVFGGQAPGPTYQDASYRLDFAGGFMIDAGGANGSVSTSQWCYGSGQTATLIAAPNQGYRFSQWLGDASGTTNPLQLTMNGFKVVRAEFVAAATGVEDEIPLAFALEVRPNPSSGVAGIEYALPRETRVKVRVFDVTGREVARLADGVQPAGRHLVHWSGTSGSARARAGIYLVRLEAQGSTWTRRFALLR